MLFQNSVYPILIKDSAIIFSSVRMLWNLYTQNIRWNLESNPKQVCLSVLSGNTTRVYSRVKCSWDGSLKIKVDLDFQGGGN